MNSILDFVAKGAHGGRNYGAFPAKGIGEFDASPSAELDRDHHGRPRGDFSGRVFDPAQHIDVRVRRLERAVRILASQSKSDAGHLPANRRPAFLEKPFHALEIRRVGKKPDEADPRRRHGRSARRHARRAREAIRNHVDSSAPAQILPIRLAANRQRRESPLEQQFAALPKKTLRDPLQPRADALASRRSTPEIGAGHVVDVEVTVGPAPLLEDIRGAGIQDPHDIILSEMGDDARPFLRRRPAAVKIQITRIERPPHFLDHTSIGREFGANGLKGRKFFLRLAPGAGIAGIRTHHDNRDFALPLERASDV